MIPRENTATTIFLTEHNAPRHGALMKALKTTGLYFSAAETATVKLISEIHS